MVRAYEALRRFWPRSVGEKYKGMNIMAAKRAGKPEKRFQEYLVRETADARQLNDYIKSPATALLRYLVDASSAVAHCRNKFTKNLDGNYNKDSQDSLRILSAALLGTIMGHFETFQRSLFAGVFEHSRFLKHFDVAKFFRSESLENTVLDLPRLSAYRGEPASIGLVLADALKGWHNPDLVNKYFQAFQIKMNFFSNEDKDSLRILWQVRHSIVHTGAWLSIPDAQKVPELLPFANSPLVFQDTFIQAVCRKLHPLVQNAAIRLHDALKSEISSGATPADIESIKELCRAESINTSWLSQPES